MPTKKYSLKETENPRLEISWQGAWKNMKINVDGQEIGTIANQKMLKQGQEFTLKDGSILNLKLNQSNISNMFTGPELIILLNGKPLPNSGSDPKAKMKTANGAVFFIAGLNLFIGLAVIIFNVEQLGGIPGGIIVFIFGLVFLGLGFFIKSLSFIALVIAFILYSLDSIYFAVSMLYQIGANNSPGTPSGRVFWIIIRASLLGSMWQGFDAIKQLKQKKNTLD